MISLEERGKEARVYYETLCPHGGRCLDCLEKAVRGACNGAIRETTEELKAANLKNQELQHEIARLTRNEKCYGCGHSKENHDPGGCLVWVDADAHRKCLCRVWTAAESPLAVPKTCPACTCPHNWKAEKSHTAHPDGPTTCARCGVEEP